MAFIFINKGFCGRFNLKLRFGFIFAIKTKMIKTNGGVLAKDVKAAQKRTLSNGSCGFISGSSHQFDR